MAAVSAVCELTAGAGIGDYKSGHYCKREYVDVDSSTLGAGMRNVAYGFEGVHKQTPQA